MVTQAQLETIQPGIKLQGDVKALLMEMGLGDRAFDLSSEIMHLVFTSDAVKPEVKEIYLEIDSGGE